MADCRRCKYFVPHYKLSGELLEIALAEAIKQNVEALGWCIRWHRIVVRYETYCLVFKPKRKVTESQKALTEFILEKSK